MNKILILAISITIFYCCQTPDNDPKLIGNWSSLSYADINEIQFYQDSIKLYDFTGESIGKWKSVDSRIYVELTHSDDLNPSGKFEWEYKLIQDSLYIKRTSDNAFVIPAMTKFENHFEQWQRILGLKINLKKTESALESVENDNSYQEIYIGYRENQVMSKINDKYVDLEKGAARIAAFTLMYTRAKEVSSEDLKFVLVIDKNIPEFKVDSIKNILRRTPIKKILRVYENDTINYHDLNWRENAVWYGLFE